MKKVFEPFCNGLKEVKENIKKTGHGYMWGERLGYILTFPLHLGTVLRAGKKN